MTDYIKYTIDYRSNIRKAVERINEIGDGFGVVVDENGNVVGIITDGDFRRAVLKGINLDENVLAITNRNFKFLEVGYSKEDVSRLFKSKVVRFLPILRNKKLAQILCERDFPSILDQNNIQKKIDAPVVIMAGGKGTRLEPFTNIFPKPLIPIGDKAMIEIIMNEYEKFGMNNFYISVYHKADMIKSYFSNNGFNFNIDYIYEDKPLGTAGALKYLNGKLNSSFFVSNCDIIIKDDYQKIFQYHNDGGYLLTMVTSMQLVKIPYGVCVLDKNGKLKQINEKPEFDYLINTGMYVLHPKALDYIPENEYFDITQLIEELVKRDKGVGVYPVAEKSYIDVGQWAEYKKAINILSTDI